MLATATMWRAPLTTRLLPGMHVTATINPNEPNGGVKPHMHSKLKDPSPRVASVASTLSPETTWAFSRIVGGIGSVVAILKKKGVNIASWQRVELRAPMSAEDD